MSLETSKDNADMQVDMIDTGAAAQWEGQVERLVHSERLKHRLQERAGWKMLLQYTLDDDDDDDNNNNILDLSASLCYNCALYTVDVLDPCMINSKHFPSVARHPQPREPSVVKDCVMKDVVD
jgi:hypothetical protein